MSTYLIKQSNNLNLYRTGHCKGQIWTIFFYGSVEHCIHPETHMCIASPYNRPQSTYLCVVYPFKY